MMTMFGYRLMTLNGRLNLGVSGLGDILLQNVSFPLHLFRCAEVDQVADGRVCNVHIVKQLLFMFGQDRFDCLELDHNRVMSEQIGDVAFLQFSAFVVNLLHLFRRKLYATFRKLHLQTLLVDFFAHAGAEFFIYFKYCTHKCIAFTAEIFCIFCHGAQAGSLSRGMRTHFAQDRWRLWFSLRHKTKLNAARTLYTCSSFIASVSVWFKRHLSAFKRYEILSFSG